MTTEDVRVQLDPADQARLLREGKAFDKNLAKAMLRRVREVATPIGREMVREVAPQLPRRGGLAYRIAAARGTVTSRTGLRTAGVTLGVTKPRVLRYIDKGKIPHPVYAQGVRAGWRWSNTQTIRSGLVTEAFRRHERQARAAVEHAVLDA